MPPRSKKIITTPVRAQFPLTLTTQFPYPDDQTFKSLSIDRLYLYVKDPVGKPRREIVELEFPKGMQFFNKQHRFDAALRFTHGEIHQGVEFHLSYEPLTAVIEGTIAPWPDAAIASMDFIDIEYSITFQPPKD